MNINKKTNKKGFTIVELVIVIAVIAILAAVLIPTFSSLVKTAQTSSDVSLVKNLNISLNTSEVLDGKNVTFTDALNDVKEDGYDVTKLTPTNSDNDILWHEESNRFVLRIKDKYESCGSDVEVDEEKLYKLWRIYNEIPALEDQTYSIYYIGEEVVDTEVKIQVGFDSNVKVESLKYESDKERTVIIRTNSANTTLTINAEYDTVNHYGSVGRVDVQKIDMNCYNEYGKAAYIEVTEGKVVAKAGGTIEVVFAANNDKAAVAVIKENQGTIEQGYTLAGDAGSSNIELTPSTIEAVEKIAVDVIETAVEKEAVEADESDFWIVCHADAFASGSGTELDPYIIKTARQLSLLAYNVNTSAAGNYATAYYKLGKDIDLSGKAWTPIGTTSGDNIVYFKGHFDGNGHSIIGLTNNDKTDVELGLYRDELSSVKGLAASYGLFGFTQNVNISDLTMESASIDGSDHFKEAGIIIGMATGSTIMTNCTVDGDSSISGKSKIGGLIGYVNLGDSDNGLGGNVNLTNCDFAGAVTVSADRAGALVGAFCAHQSGYNLGHTHVFKDCDSTGTVSSGKYGTGLIGFIYQGVAQNTYGIKSFIFDNCSVDTSKFSTNSIVGKYIGRHSDATSTIIIKGTDETYSTNLIGDLNSYGSFILCVNGQFYGYKYNQSGAGAMPLLDSNIETYKVSQMITNAPGKEYESYWKTDRMEVVAPYMTLIKIDETSLDVTSGELKYGAGWYDTKIADFSSFVAEGYHVVAPEDHATYDSTGTHYIWQVVADSE